MNTRELGQRGWDLRPVPWSQWQEFTRGLYLGLPLLSWNTAPREKLATKRQLRAQGLRPGGQSPVALLYFRHRTACTWVLANLYLIERAKPVRPMTPARWRAQAKATAARRTCRECGTDAGVELPKTHRLCEPCRYTLGLLEADDYLHDYLTGTPIAPAPPERLAPVIPLHPHAASTADSWGAA